MATISAREFNHDVSGAKRQASVEPVIITDRGKPSFVLLNMDEYRRLSGRGVSLLNVFQRAERGDFDYEFEKANIVSSDPDL